MKIGTGPAEVIALQQLAGSINVNGQSLTGLVQYQFFWNTTASPTGTTLNVWDGTAFGFLDAERNWLQRCPG